MPEMVLLRHDTPDGGWHYDWLIDPGEGAPLVSFRLGGRLDEAGDGASLVAERMADHRRVYLTHEGEISGGRGRVRRIARGEWRRAEIGEERVLVEGWLGERHGVFVAERDGGGWVVRREGKSSEAADPKRSK